MLLEHDTSLMFQSQVLETLNHQVNSYIVYPAHDGIRRRWKKGQDQNAGKMPLNTTIAV